MFPKQWQQEEHHISWIIAKIILQFPESEQISNKMPRLKREAVLPDARARNTTEKQSLLEVLETNVDPNQNLGLVKKQCWG